MKLKQRPGDFRVLEILRDGVPGAKGPHHIYRVTKSKLTTLEVVDRLAAEAGVEKRAVEFAGLKDRQGVTTQYISILGGKRLKLHEPGLIVEWAADSEAPIDSSWLRANGFDLTLRGLSPEELERFERSQGPVRSQGVPNYFDDQRFGALRHGQGFIAREILEGKVESALMRCLLNPSPFDPPREAAFKGRLRRAWGDFQQCVKLCRGGKHISVFQHLAENPGDFAGAWRFVSTRIRLIHLYAFQSYLWNLTVSAYLRSVVPEAERVLLSTDMGALVAFHRLGDSLAAELRGKSIPLLAPDVTIRDATVRSAVDEVLAREGLTLEKLKAPGGVEGFAFKAEERALLVVPAHFRVLKPEPDEINPGLAKIRLRFELPRGSYATLVVKRLFAVAGFEEAPAPVAAPAEGPFQPRGRKLLAKPPALRESGMLPNTYRRRGEEGKTWRNSSAPMPGTDRPRFPNKRPRSAFSGEDGPRSFPPKSADGPGAKSEYPRKRPFGKPGPGGKGRFPRFPGRPPRRDGQDRGGPRSRPDEGPEKPKSTPE
ncbi:MAG: tRNA pseudouridine(13) synthase TruD [Planctomycetes bacterium]|nr:tRNA pseudouridine(13) synthase TruD [Planctomycetota bacterium]